MCDVNTALKTKQMKHIHTIYVATFNFQSEKCYVQRCFLGANFCKTKPQKLRDCGDTKHTIRTRSDPVNFTETHW